MESPSFELPVHDFELDFCPKHLTFSPIIEREKFRKNIDIRFLKTIQPYLNEFVDKNTLFFLKGTGNNSRIEYQDNKISYINTLNASISEWDYPNDNNTIANYNFNESSNAISFKDETNNYPLTAGGAPTADVVGKSKRVKYNSKNNECKKILTWGLPRAVSLDGTDDYLFNPTLLGDALSNGTIEMWFAPNTNWTTYRHLWNKCPAATAIGEINGAFKAVTTGIDFYIYETNSVYHNAGTSQTSWLANTWYHIAHLWGTANTWGSTGMKNIVNGSVDGTNSYTGSNGSGNTNAFCLGCHFEPSGFGDFKVDLLRISNIQRTQFGGIAPSVIL